MDIITMIQKFIVPIVFVICYFVGIIIKTSLDWMDNKHIPLILGVIGIAISAWVNMAFTPTVLAIGLASAWASTGFYELTKNYELTDFFKNFFNKFNKEQ